jgi:uncharacterized protein YgbK (DUF1537 family)
VLGLVADDLTGAGDAAMGFAGAGWRAVLCLDPERPSPGSGAGPSVLAVSTGSRAATDDEAARRTARAVEALVALGADRLYLKVDSTVRGSVAGQLDGALAAWAAVHPGARAVVCPAFPEQGRTVVDGQVLVDGAPLAGSATVRDPVTPRTDGDLGRVLPGSVSRDAGPVAAAPGSRLVVDARDDDDLARLAGLLDAAGPEVVVVGSGGLAAALGRRWAEPVEPFASPGVRGRVLVAVSSLHPATAAQLVRLGDGSSTADVDVLTTTSVTTTPDDAVADLAARVGAALDGHPYAAVVVVGGDGAAAVLAGLGADHVQIDHALVPGCATGIVAGGRADGLRVVTKSGGFGGPATLDEIVRRLRADGAGPGAEHPGAGPFPSPEDTP